MTGPDDQFIVITTPRSPKGLAFGDSVPERHTHFDQDTAIRVAADLRLREPGSTTVQIMHVGSGRLMGVQEVHGSGDARVIIITNDSSNPC